MKNAILILALALLHTTWLARSARSESLATPGIYRLEPDSHLHASVMPPERPQTHTVERFEHALPGTPKDLYAMVARNQNSETNVVVLVHGLAAGDKNSGDPRCFAYAFPSWADRNCATGQSAFELGFEWHVSAFTASRPDQEKSLRSERVPAQRRPTDGEERSCILFGVCAPEAYGYWLQRREVTHFADRFSLVSRRDYTNIIRPEQELSMFALPDRQSSRSKVSASTYLAVISTSPEWYEVELISGDGTISHGWIDRDDLEVATWTPQRAKTKNFRFRAALATGDQTPDGGALVAIEVLDRSSGARVQVLRDIQSEAMRTAADEHVQLIDANFDGYADIMATGSSGGAGPNSASNVFLFDPVRRRFAFDATLSGLSQISFDPKRRTVHSAQRNSCCSHSAQTYRYLNGALTLVGEWDESLSADGRWMVTTTSRLHKGKMHYQTRRIRTHLD